MGDADNMVPGLRKEALRNRRNYKKFIPTEPRQEGYLTESSKSPPNNPEIILLMCIFTCEESGAQTS